MLETEAWERLRHFRNALYDNLGLRQDSLFELLDAALTAPHRSTLVRLSLTAAFRRRWPKARIGGLRRVATSAAMYSATRTALRPPQTMRLPRFWPLSWFSGARP